MHNQPLKKIFALQKSISTDKKESGILVITMKAYNDAEV